MGLVERSYSVTLFDMCIQAAKNQWCDITNSVDKQAAQAPNKKHAQVIWFVDWLSGVWVGRLASEKLCPRPKLEKTKRPAFCSATKVQK